MSIDVLQDKIRKLKNPAMVDLALAASDLPSVLLEQEGSAAKAANKVEDLAYKVTDKMTESMDM